MAHIILSLLDKTELACVLILGHPEMYFKSFMSWRLIILAQDNFSKNLLSFKVFSIQESNIILLICAF